MSKGKRKRKGGGPGRGTSQPAPADLSAEVRARLDSIRAGTEERAIWGELHKLLLKSGADANAIARCIIARDPDAVEKLLTSLEAGGEAESTADVLPARDIPAETLRRAMHAFRKRLKLTRLDHESKLGVGPMSSGRKADVDAILPPREFDEAVWRALVAEGNLKDAGQGFYALKE